MGLASKENKKDENSRQKRREEENKEERDRPRARSQADAIQKWRQQESKIHGKKRQVKGPETKHR